MTDSRYEVWGRTFGALRYGHGAYAPLGYEVFAIRAVSAIGAVSVIEAVSAVGAVSVIEAVSARDAV